jgi:type IV pili sensor histidine kinase/response regulator
MQASTRVLRRPAVAGLLASGLLIAGCATTTAPSEQAAPPASVAPTVLEPKPVYVPVARYGRYTLVELVPGPAQRDLMQQVVEIAVPPTLDANVGDALRHLLAHTGHRLCDTNEAAALYALALPAAHLRLGPLTLRDALLVLAGPAWDLTVDDASREVCFRRLAVAAPVIPDTTPATDTAPGAQQPETTEPEEVQP